MKVKFLKERKDSGALAFQRKIPKHLTGKAKVYNIKPVVTLPLDLSIGASEVQVVTRIDQRNKQFETLLRFLEQTDHHAVSSADWEKTARAYLKVKGPKAGTLKNVEVGSDEFDYRMDEALGVNADQHRQGWDEVYPDAERMPEQFIDAIYEILQHREGSKRFHLFSDAIDYYKAYKESEINKLGGTGLRENVNAESSKRIVNVWTASWISLGTKSLRRTMPTKN